MITVSLGQYTSRWSSKWFHVKLITFIINPVVFSSFVKQFKNSLQLAIYVKNFLVPKWGYTIFVREFAIIIVLFALSSLIMANL